MGHTLGTPIHDRGVTVLKRRGAIGGYRNGCGPFCMTLQQFATFRDTVTCTLPWAISPVGSHPTVLEGTPDRCFYTSTSSRDALALDLLKKETMKSLQESQRMRLFITWVRSLSCLTMSDTGVGWKEWSGYYVPIALDGHW